MDWRQGRLCILPSATTEGLRPTLGVFALDAGTTGADSEQYNWENKNILRIANKILQWMRYIAMLLFD